MNKKTIVTLLTVAFFGAGALFFSLGVQKYQVLTSSRAENRGLGIWFTFLSEGEPFKWKATVGANTNNLPSQLAEYGVYHCGTSSGTKGQGKGGYCDRSSADFIRLIIGEDRTIVTTVGSSFELTHQAVTCGRVQIDLGDKEAPGVFGGDTYDTGTSCAQPTATPAAPTNTPGPTNTQGPTSPPGASCPYTDLNTQFRIGTEGWVDGSVITSRNLQLGSTIAINCFANNGSAVINPADISVNGTVIQSNTVGSVDAYSITQAGVHTVVCKDSQNRPNCSNTDSFTIVQAATPTATHTAVPPTATAVPPTATAVPPTATRTPVPPTATHTAVPPTATHTAVPPTATHTAVPPTATAVPPTPTQVVVVVTNSPTPVIIVEAPTPTPVTQLTVAEQKPGITPWVILLIPFALILLGLAL